MVLVQAQDNAGILVAEMIDQAVVKTAIARAGVEADILDAETPQHLRRDIAAPGHAGVGVSFQSVETHCSELLHIADQDTSTISTRKVMSVGTSVAACRPS